MAARLYAPQPHTPQTSSPTRYPRRVLDMAIVTPIWEESLEPTAQAFVKRSLQATTELPHWFVAPESLDTTWYEQHFPNFRITRFPDQFFRSSQTYSQLLIDPAFYRTFEAHEFITICQTDAVLINNPAQVNMDNVDYLGAPWNPPLNYLKISKRLYVTSNFRQDNESRIVRLLGTNIHVGNGGLSIRRITTHIEVTSRISKAIDHRYLSAINEDALLCSIGPKLGLRIAPKQLAETVFLESEARQLTEVPTVFGFHGLERWNSDLAQLVVRTAE